MTIKLSSIQFLHGLNRFANQSGAVVALGGVEPDYQLDMERLMDWLRAIPTSMALPSKWEERSLRAVIPKLLLAFTEHCRLSPSPAKVLFVGDQDLIIWLPVDSRQAAIASVRLLLHCCESVRSCRAPDSLIPELWAELRRAQWNQTHAHLARAAKELNIPFQRVDRAGHQMLQLGQGQNLRLFRETITDTTPLIAKPAVDKQLLHVLLHGAGIPLPSQILVRSLEQALVAAEQIGWPVVLKPASGGKGRGVWVGLADRSALTSAWAVNAQHGAKDQLIQKMIFGHDYRLLVVNGQVLAAARRIPASLVSDGELPLRKQIEHLNADPRRGVGYERMLNRIVMDNRLESILAQQQMTLETVPATGTRVQLSLTANLSQGGTAVECLGLMHPDNRRLAEDVALLLHADVAGLDFISKDLGISWLEGGTSLLEANLSPGLRPHLVADPETTLCRTLVETWMAGRPRLGKIHTCWITGADGFSISELVVRLLSFLGKRTGRVAGGLPELDSQALLAHMPIGQDPVQFLLRDPRVEALVVEADQGHVANRSLDAPDVMALLDLGDPMAGVAVSSGCSCLVFDAADPHAYALMQSLRMLTQKIVLVGMPEQADRLQDHLLTGNPVIMYGMEDGDRIDFYSNGKLDRSASRTAVARALNLRKEVYGTFPLAVSMAIIMSLDLDLGGLANRQAMSSF